MRSEINHHVKATHFTCHVVLDIVLDFISSPQDYTKTCVALKSLAQEHDTELHLLHAVRPGWEVRIMSWKINSPQWLIALDRLWRFYEHTNRIRLYADTCQTEIRNTQRVLMARWRFILKYIVDTFYNRCQKLQTSDDSIFLFEGIDGHTRVWNWITDNDMMIFVKCRNLSIEFADLITDKGLMSMKNVRKLRIYGGKFVTGAAFGKLADECHLRQVIITGFPEYAGYDDALLEQLKARRSNSNLYLSDQLIKKK